MRMVAYFDVHRRWLVTLATILLALLILSQGGQSSPADVSGPSPIARKRAPAAGKRPKGAKPLSRPAGRRPTLPVPERRKDEVKIGGSKTAAPAAAQVEVEEVEEGLLEEAMRERSINKYFSADPLWTGQLIASGMAWFLVLTAASLPADVAGERPVLMILTVRHAFGLAADVRRVLREAAEGEVDRRKIRKLARGLTRVPGAPSYLLYSAALLTWPATNSPKGVVKALGPLLLREFYTALAAGLDMLQILGVSSEAASGPAAAARCGPRRFMPGSLSTISLVFEASLGLSLVVALLRSRNEGGMLLRRCLATLLYANFLYNRVGHLPGLKEALGRRSVGGSAAALLKPLFKDLEPTTRQLTAIGRASLAELDTVPGVGEKVRSTLRLLGFLEDEQGVTEEGSQGNGGLS